MENKTHLSKPYSRETQITVIKDVWSTALVAIMRDEASSAETVCGPAREERFNQQLRRADMAAEHFKKKYL